MLLHFNTPGGIIAFGSWSIHCRSSLSFLENLMLNLSSAAPLSMRLSAVFKLVFELVLFALICPASASTAAAARPEAETTSYIDQCSSQREEDRILCAAAREKEESIKQVINEDETAKREPEPPSASATDVWKAAYERWISDREPRAKHKSLNRAMRHALKTNPDVKAAERASPVDELPEVNDDELTIITAAVLNISSESTSSEHVISSLTTIEDLCYSGDNGRQMVASGGVPHLLRLAALEATSLPSIRALATCAQNNPTVFDTAVEAGAVRVLLGMIGVSDSIRAASLRALVAIGDSDRAMGKMTEERDSVIRAVKESLAITSKERRRCVIRALALVENCVTRESEWKEQFLKSGIVRLAESEMKNDDVDLREGAARVLRLLR